MSKYKDKKPSMIEFTRKYFLCNNRSVKRGINYE